MAAHVDQKGMAASGEMAAAGEAQGIGRRTEKVASAVRFLKHPNVRTSTPRARMLFLEKKGLSVEEIAEALRQVDPTSNEYALVSAGANEGIKASEAVASEIDIDDGYRGGGVDMPAAQARINQLSAQVSQLQREQEKSSSWFQILLPASVLVALGAGLGYLASNYLPRVTITIGPPPGTKGEKEVDEDAEADAPTSSSKQQGDTKASRPTRRRRKRSDEDSDDSDLDSELDDSRAWKKKLLEAGGLHKSPRSPGPSKEDFQRLKSEIDHLADELSISSSKNANALEDIREMLEAMRKEKKEASVHESKIKSIAQSSEGQPVVSQQSQDTKEVVPPQNPPKNLGEAILRMKNSSEGNPKIAVNHLKFFFNKTKDNPAAGKLNKGNPTVKRIIEVEGAQDFIKFAGFESDAHSFIFKKEEDMTPQNEKLKSALELLERYDALQAPLPSQTEA